ncbi:MAG: glycosyltransferase, partial [Rhodothermia bacterium]
GRLTAAKNYPLLLRAFQTLLQSRDANLLILGEGEERAKLQGLIHDLGIEDHVLLPGYVENPWAYMSKADLFVLSSKWEGLPTVLVEALALGIRVVSTDCEYGPRELLEDGRYGLLVPVDDVDHLAAGMLKALDSDPPGVRLSDLEEFRLDTAVKRYRTLLLNGS